MMNPVRVTLLGQASVLAACLLVSACSALPKGEVSLDLGIKDRGVASWYGDAFHGKLAANGEVFDMTAYTAAHRKLPLGSVVRVMNLDNGKVVQVRITDRGPYVLGRMLDLSQAAAQELGMVQAGTAAVQLEVIGESQAIRGLPRSLPLTTRRAGDVATPSHPPLDGLERPAVCARTGPQDLWYVRRERRHGSQLPAHNSARRAASLLIYS
jgi:rare lipoprotein A